MLEFSHIGCLTKDIEDCLDQYRVLGCNETESGAVTVESQKVKIKFLNIGNNIHLELIQPLDINSNLYKLMSRGVTFYHIAFRSKGYDLIRSNLQKYNLIFITEFDSEAFDNKRCLFVKNNHNHLIEIIED